MLFDFTSNTVKKKGTDIKKFKIFHWWESFKIIFTKALFHFMRGIDVTVQQSYTRSSKKWNILLLMISLFLMHLLRYNVPFSSNICLTVLFLTCHILLFQIPLILSLLMKLLNFKLPNVLTVIWCPINLNIIADSEAPK